MQDENVQALLWLARDDNPVIARTAADELVAYGEAVLPHLAELADTDPETASAISKRVQARLLEADWEELAATPDAEWGAILIARWADPLLEPTSVVAQIDKLAEPLAGRIPRSTDTKSLRTAAQTLSAWLSGEHDFRGDTETYYQPYNSFIHVVLSRRQGLPIVLSLLYVLVGRRLGVPVYPIGMPAHVIVRVGPEDADLYLDPFEGGRSRTREECRQWLQENGLGWRASFLDPISDREVLARMLRNLVSSYRRAGDASAQRQLMRYYRILSGETLDVSSV